jgi:LuxR family maltose regulon positive regulatory protein
VRSFVDAGLTLKPLLEQLQRNGAAPHYLQKLIAAYSQNGQTETPLRTQSPEMTTLLTPRELEILQLMQSGLGNAEIAQELVISPHTVKRHAANIYRKLDVKNRRQAVYKAQQVDLLRLD